MNRRDFFGASGLFGAVAALFVKTPVLDATKITMRRLTDAQRKQIVEEFRRLYTGAQPLPRIVLERDNCDIRAILRRPREMSYADRA